MPKILVARKIPSSVLEKLKAVGEVDLYAGEDPMTPEALRARVKGKTALVSMLTEQVDKTLIDVRPISKIVANVAVGQQHRHRVRAIKGVIVTHTPDVLTEAVAGFHLNCHPGYRPANQRGRPNGAAWRVEGRWAFDFMRFELHGAARPHQSQPHWRSGRSQGASLRHAGGVAHRSTRRSSRRRSVSFDRAQHVGHRVAPCRAPAGTASIDREPRPHEALGLPDQHRSRSAIDEEALAWALRCLIRARRWRLRTRAEGAPDDDARELLLAPHCERHDRDADSDGRARGEQRDSRTERTGSITPVEITPTPRIKNA